MTSRGDPRAQLTLPITAGGRFDFASFEAGTNHELVAALDDTVRGNRRGNIFLWGAGGTGKSHLLQAACNQAGELGLTPFYVPLAEPGLIPDILNGLAGMDLVCMDDLHRICARPDWELAVFKLFNEMRENSRPIVFAANGSPRGIGLQMPDLESRLSWDLVYRLDGLDEDLLTSALRKRAETMQFELPDEVIEFLIRRVNRDTHSLFDILGQLDKASLQSKRKLTVPFVKELLQL